ncbi:MAG TPA: BlaI/MecI/CopY family transcriptional regulator [Pyrinomonadaceae bacterium]|nr:BlaI/MecI/CopY family transcriptional regulator [Acidobacteriota bacterium]HQZ94943.1 BlaI/MecI/CopY family transcriptional regulator [Pyrinomonadaceae bacterium]
MLSAKFRLRGNQRLSDVVLDSLGDLERRVMIEVRRLGESNVTSVNHAMHDAYAYTTVMTTLDRLYKKGLLDRRKDGRAFLYTAKHTVEELERGMAEDIIGRLFETSAGKVEPVLACIVDSVSERDMLLLDELERLVKEKRMELGKEE